MAGKRKRKSAGQRQEDLSKPTVWRRQHSGFSAASFDVDPDTGVVVTHHRRRVARIVPEPSPANALEVFEDLHGVLGEREGAVLANTLGAVRKAGGLRETIEELRNPWVS